MVNIKLKCNFAQTQSNFIRTDEDPSLRIESFAMIKLRGVSTKLYFYFNKVYTMNRLSLNFDLIKLFIFERKDK